MSGMVAMDLRYRATDRLTMGRALLALITLAWDTDLDFEFGPPSVDILMISGLVVTGPDLDPIRAELSKIPGLSETEA